MNDARLAFWTVTTWRDEAAMRAYMIAGAHKAAMPKLMDWCDEAATAHWDQDDMTPPTWAEAHARLVAGGRPSKVRRPSQAHLDNSIPAPRTR